jgi:exosome complex RNA-binding protein Rrp42 (RNase PH superfamily)
MPREVEPSLNERQFFAKALSENIRLDGREFDQFRALELEFSDEYGVAEVRLGKTRYVHSPAFALYSLLNPFFLRQSGEGNSLSQIS